MYYGVLRWSRSDLMIVHSIITYSYPLQADE